MNLRKFYPTVLLVVTLAGCAFSTAQQTPAATTSNAQQVEPTITLLDPNARAREAANHAAAVAMTATADAQIAIDTQVAQQRAQVEATRAAVGLTQQVEQFNAASTQNAVSVAATGTAVQFAAVGQMARATQTAVAMAGDFSRATQQAAVADEQRTAAQRRASEEAIQELERQTWFVVKILLVGLLLVGSAIGIFYAAKWLSVIIAIDARRRLVHEQARLVYDNNAAAWKLMPGAEGLPPPEPQPQPTRKERLAAAIKPTTARPNPVSMAQTQERATRAQWRQAAKNFLYWGESTGSFSMRKMRDTANISDGDWRAMTSFLSDFGLLEKGKNNAYQLAHNETGEQMGVGEALRDKRLIASFELPNGTPPDIPVPQNARNSQTHHTTPHTNTHTHTHQHTRNTHEKEPNSTNIVKYASEGTYGLMGPRYDGNPDDMPTSGIR